MNNGDKMLSSALFTKNMGSRNRGTWADRRHVWGNARLLYTPVRGACNSVYQQGFERCMSTLPLPLKKGCGLSYWMLPRRYPTSSQELTNFHHRQWTESLGRPARSVGSRLMSSMNVDCSHGTYTCTYTANVMMIYDS